MLEEKLKSIMIGTRTSVMEAMLKLDDTAEKILLVTDHSQKLIGTLTDGDIRRCILKEQNLIGVIENAYNRNPMFVFKEDFNQEKVKQIFTKNKIDLLPILEKNRKVVDYITWEKLFGNDRKSEDQGMNVPVVIMAGGSGTRLEPFTKVLPKPLIPVGEKPVIDHIIDKFKDHGIREFYLTIHHKSKILRAYFEEQSPDYPIEFVEESEPRGTAGSLTLLKERLDRPFFLSNCDIIIKADYSDIYRFHTNKNNDITVVASTKQFHIPYGICELNRNGSLERIQEKPAYNFLVNTGLYILDSGMIDLIPDDKVFHITDLMDKVRENKGTIGVYPVSEKAWIDVGQWGEYRNSLKLMEGV